MVIHTSGPLCYFTESIIIGTILFVALRKFFPDYLIYIPLDLLQVMKNNEKHEDLQDKFDHQDDTQSNHPNNNVVKEIGGPKGPEPTRYGDWEKRGRCIDF